MVVELNLISEAYQVYLKTLESFFFFSLRGSFEHLLINLVLNIALDDDTGILTKAAWDEVKERLSKCNTLQQS